MNKHRRLKGEGCGRRVACWVSISSLRMMAAGLLLAASAVRADNDPEARFKGTGKADPIRIENVQRTDGKSAGQSAVTCDLAWDHSWRAAWELAPEQTGGTRTLNLESWDAAWVFVKFHKPGVDGWSHATLSTAAGDHQAPAGATLEVGKTDDGKRGLGAFVYRREPGAGPNAWKGVTLRWLHEADGVKDPASYEVKVLAIPMVYVPQCEFWLGDGGTNDFAGQFRAGKTFEPFRVTSEKALTLGGESQENLGNTDTIGTARAEDFTSAGTQVLPAAFPKGFAAFYCMRYELTQGEYAIYLNTLSSDQQGSLRLTRNSDQRNGLKVAVPGKPGTAAVCESSTPHLPMSWLTWRDAMAYAAWAGLRPITELEFEKACRGPVKPAAHEFAWGTDQIVGKISYGRPERGYYLDTNHVGTAAETLTWKGDLGPFATTNNTGDVVRGNALWDGSAKSVQYGPVRVGVFATPTSGRMAAGASYWGIMELSGNLWETMVAVCRPAGRSFSGTHGDGTIALPVGWTFRGEGIGLGKRGGGVLESINYDASYKQNDKHILRVSDRVFVSFDILDREPGGSGPIGFRFVRTAGAGAQ